MKKVIGLSIVLSLLLVPSARADLGITSTAPSSGVAGDTVQLTIGCGFCFPPCEGRPGHRHPRGQRNGVCMLDTHRDPPPAFPVWLTSLDHSLKPYRCGGPEARVSGAGCQPGFSRPSHLPSFVFLGRAMRLPESGRIRRGDVPRYRLSFEIPEIGAGSYKYVVFCDSCYPGPRGSLVESPSTGSGRLQVLSSETPGGAGGAGAGTGPWIAGGIATVVFGLVLGLSRRRRVAGSQAGPAA
jgi:hypothetical protein